MHNLSLTLFISYIVLLTTLIDSETAVNITLRGIQFSFSHLSNVAAPPSFLRLLSHKILFVPGKTIELACEASGIPPPDYTWYKDGRLLFIPNDMGIEQRIGSGTLDIAEPMSHHEGFYQCFASNKFGTAISMIAYLRKAVLEPFPRVVEPRIHQPSIGSPFTLKCRSPASYPEASMYWVEDSYEMQRIETNTRVSLDYQGNLHFSNIVAEDSRGGHSYVCVAHNSELRHLAQGDDQVIEPVLDSNKVLHRPRLMWSSPAYSSALKGETKRMKCIFSGNPTPKVTWTRLGLPTNGRMSTPAESYGQEFVIDDVTFDDTGYYQCSATNSISTPVSFLIHLVVESPPYWLRGAGPSDVTVCDEDEAEFICSVAGYPQPTIEWSINGIPLDGWMNASSSLHTIGSSWIRLTNVSQENIFVLQCNASNKHGYLFANSYLNVLAEPPLFIETSPNAAVVAEGQKVNLKCGVFGAPIPTLEWTRLDGMKLTESVQLSKQDTSVTLFMEAAKFDDAGIYQCESWNKFGRRRYTVNVSVRKRTRIIQFPSAPLTLSIMSTASLNCTATTDPQELTNLQIRWFSSDLVLSSNRDPRISIDVGGYLRIARTHVADTGSYTCVASNGVDSDSMTTSLIVRDRPEPPINVQLTRCNATVAEVSWSPGKDNNDPIIQYLVYFNVSHAESHLFSYSSLLSPSSPSTASSLSSLSSSLVSAVDSWLLGGAAGSGGPIYYKGARAAGNSLSAFIKLRPWTEYTFHVSALNSLGESKRSEMTKQTCSTPQAKPSRNPGGVCTDMRDNRALIITWEPMSAFELNAEGFYYMITYQRHDVTPSFVFKTPIKDWRIGQVSVVMPDTDFKQFLVYVEAVNSEGFAQSSKQDVKIGYSGEGNPSVIPKNLGANVTGTTVEFYWDEVDDDPRIMRGVFIGYQLNYWNYTAPPPTVETYFTVFGNESTNSTNDSTTYPTTTSLPTTNEAMTTVEPEQLVVLSVFVPNNRSSLVCSSHATTLKLDSALSSSSSSSSTSSSSSSQVVRPLFRYTLKLWPNTSMRATVRVVTANRTGDPSDFVEFWMEEDIVESTTVLDLSTDNMENYTNFDYKSGVTKPASKAKRLPRTRLGIPMTSATWFVVMMCAISFMLLILMIICIVKRRRGQQYAVQEKEMLRGQDIETKDDTAFGEYMKRFTIPAPKRFRKRCDRDKDSESGSFREYDEHADMIRFLEDGSFIGQYCGITKTEEPMLTVSPNALSTFV